MSSSGETSSPRRVWPRVLGWSCLTVLAVGSFSIFGSFCYLYVSHGITARKANEQNLAAVNPILSALDDYRRTNGRYPKSLCDLHLKQLPRFEGVTQVLYSISENGGEFWLAIFPWREASIVMPSDWTREYSSTNRKWAEMDINDATAKRDEAWGNGCTAETMTTTR
jgi:hypothetical protein